jgi:hypothetical protein
MSLGTVLVLLDIIVSYIRLKNVTKNFTNYQTSKPLFHRIGLFQAAWFLRVSPG